MIKIESEWDFGYENTVFNTKEQAISTLRNDPNVKDVCEDTNKSVDELIAEGYISFQTVLLG